nr:MAG TPA: hypothetical protein [Caudoviricetes sp.]
MLIWEFMSLLWFVCKDYTRNGDVVSPLQGC